MWTGDLALYPLACRPMFILPIDCYWDYIHDVISSCLFVICSVFITLSACCDMFLYIYVFMWCSYIIFNSVCMFYWLILWLYIKTVLCVLYYCLSVFVHAFYDALVAICYLPCFTLFLFIFILTLVCRSTGLMLNVHRMSTMFNQNDKWKRCCKYCFPRFYESW